MDLPGWVWQWHGNDKQGQSKASQRFAAALLRQSPRRGVTQTVASALISSTMDSNSIAQNSFSRQRQGAAIRRDGMEWHDVAWQRHGIGLAKLGNDEDKQWLILELQGSGIVQRGVATAKQSKAMRGNGTAELDMQRQGLVLN